jgi:hypothetical protein
MNTKRLSMILLVVACLLLSAFLVSAVSVDTVSLAEPDNFYSSFSGNDVVNIEVTTTGAVAVFANFSGLQTTATIDCGTGSNQINLVNDTSALTHWVGSCDLGAEAAVTLFSGGPVAIVATDGENFTLPPDLSQLIVLYNMTTLTDSQCTQWGADSTDFSEVSNFSSLNFVLEPLINVSCLMGAALPAGLPAWTSQFTKLAMINFSSVDMSNETQAQKIGTINSYLQLNITLPGQFGDSRIYINTSYLADLNTDATISLYHLPFASVPSILEDAGAAGVSGTLAWVQGAGEGNLTFTVLGFSGYNVTDGIAPSINITSPANTTLLSPVEVNVSINATGSALSYALINVSGNLYYYNYSSSQNTANCTAVSTGSELYRCRLTQSLNSVISKINVLAIDFGAASGNQNTATRSFSVDVNGPASTGSAIKRPSNATYTNNSWTNTNVTFQVASCTGPAACNLTYVCFNTTSSSCEDYNLASIGKLFNVSAEGTTYFSYFSNDILGIDELEKLFIVKIDKTAPNVTITTPTSGHSDTTVNIGFDVAETNLNACKYSIDSGDNTTLGSCSASSNIISDAWSTGSHTVWVWAVDSAGNTGYATISFTKTAEEETDTSGGGGGSSSTDSWTTTYVVDTLQAAGYSKALSANQRLKVKIGGADHYVGVKSISGTTATVEVTSTPQTAILAAGESKKFELTNDTYYDLYVKNNGVSGGKANITIKAIHEAVQAAPAPALTPTPTTPALAPVPAACTPDWKCGNWTTCVKSAQTRVCTDSNSCNNATSKPSESQKCEAKAASKSSEIIVAVALIVTVLCVGAFFFFKWKKEK